MKELKELRNKRIILRVTEGEKKQIFEKAKKCNMVASNYIRKLSVGANIVAKTDVDTVMQLKKIGTNINQIAHALNQSVTNESIIPLQNELENLKSFLLNLNNKILQK